jgi:putative phosphoribosyl transferase
VPERPVGAVVFAHCSGSSRHSPRNRYVAGVLNHAGLATLRLDLLTPDEELDRANVFDEEPGTLQAAAELARVWFTGHLAARPRPVGARLAEPGSGWS